MMKYCVERVFCFDDIRPQGWISVDSYMGQAYACPGRPVQTRTVMELASALSTDRPNLRGEICRTAEDDGERVEGIDVEIGEQSDFGEDLGAQEVGLVDEQDGMNVGGVGHAGARRCGAAGVVVIVAGGIEAQVGAAHPSVGVGVDQARLADVAPAVVNEQAAVARRQRSGRRAGRRVRRSGWKATRTRRRRG